MLYICVYNFALVVVVEAIVEAVEAVKAKGK